ncbi:Metal-dependent hydrolase YbeY, involved in rRNA and/or ribosome maturation and assembly [hydrothermal vent metagenome]|uniref:Metal-dependent hydrolase YbeY, involved in rRNA and/or ribosome maturation and assembly n=1 Tax=hydrothermal vent metagenome TaxID=652676 RepID=A0A1W1BHA1_9ZZZZ
MKIIDLENQTDLPVDIDALEAIAQNLTTKEIELILTDNASIRELNQEHREKDKPTDVLSFPMDAPFTEQSIFGMPLGSIVISADFVKEKAKELGHTIQDELSLLFIHGMLHLLGFDHESDHGEMREREKEIIKQFHLPSSLIVRTSH